MADNAIHTPAQLVQADEFLPYKDLLTAITDPKRTYTKAEIRALLKKTLTKEVQ